MKSPAVMVASLLLHRRRVFHLSRVRVCTRTRADFHIQPRQPIRHLLLELRRRSMVIAQRLSVIPCPVMRLVELHPAVAQSLRRSAVTPHRLLLVHILAPAIVADLEVLKQAALPHRHHLLVLLTPALRLLARHHPVAYQLSPEVRSTARICLVTQLRKSICSRLSSTPTMIRVRQALTDRMVPSLPSDSTAVSPNLVPSLTSMAHQI
jgi:hypothetical protein